MKSFYSFLICVVFTSAALKAQNFQVTQLSDNAVLNDGDVISVNVTTYPDAKVHFHTTNISNNPIRMYMKVYNMTNADGSMMETCYGGVCVSSVTLNQILPSNGLVLNPGGNNGDNDFYFNTATTSTTGQFPIEYVFQFYEADDLGTPIGNSVYITYSYTPENLGMEDVQSPTAAMGIQVMTTQVKEELQINSTEIAQVSIYNMEGKQIKNTNLLSGVNTISLLEIPRGVYILNFTNSMGSAQQKILKL